MKFGRNILSFRNFSFRNRVVVIFVGLALGVLSLLYTNKMAQRLKEKEQHDVVLWTHAMERANRDVMGNSLQDPLIQDIINNSNNIPFIITDENLKVHYSHLVPDEILDHPDKLRRQIDRFTDENPPVQIRYWWSSDHYHIIFYGQSALLKSLYYFPYIQLLVITAFILLDFVAFRSTKHDEQNRVWIGLAKETAHINEVVGESVMYFRKRIPRNVTLDYNGLAIAPVQANINAALFEWVVENLMKNSLDALQGHGAIDVRISSDDKHVMVDVRDTGKGIPKSNWKRIFEPGFTTKTRGWGLGLSLSRRIVEEYHGGKIAVVDSEIGKGTTIRVTLKRSFEQ